MVRASLSLSLSLCVFVYSLFFGTISHFVKSSKCFDAPLSPPPPSLFCKKQKNTQKTEEKKTFPRSFDVSLLFFISFARRFEFIPFSLRLCFVRFFHLRETFLNYIHLLVVVCMCRQSEVESSSFIGRVCVSECAIMGERHCC